jgi:hypothetical protein
MVFSLKKNILIPNVAEKNILILVDTYWFLVVKHSPLTPYIKMKYQEKGEIIFSRTGSSKSSS